MAVLQRNKSCLPQSGSSLTANTNMSCFPAQPWNKFLSLHPAGNTRKVQWQLQIDLCLCDLYFSFRGPGAGERVTSHQPPRTLMKIQNKGLLQPASHWPLITFIQVGRDDSISCSTSLTSRAAPKAFLSPAENIDCAQVAVMCVSSQRHSFTFWL